ncbi:hypothetical protein DPMN_078883 [Dreissena polymorpha]|uniref:Uncharacterized protein n=1 Tax=Dreissena polymorpha TaxID=45954 RepID=A0A9D3YPP2_DREPO|nr:hypothetical protein DPMN_078883 [Dreissena polymorpha]
MYRLYQITFVLHFIADNNYDPINNHTNVYNYNSFVILGIFKCAYIYPVNVVIAINRINKSDSKQKPRGINSFHSGRYTFRHRHL